MLRKISQDRALEDAQALVHERRRRTGTQGYSDHLREVADVLDEIRAELPQLREENERLKRRIGALGSEHPDAVYPD